MPTKLAKSAVDYGPGHKDSHCGPTKEWRRGSCAHFRTSGEGYAEGAPGKCELVEGSIKPDMWCKKWAKKRVLYG